MKKHLEITLRTLHIGGARRVVTLTLDGKSPADDFIKKLHKSNRPAFDSLHARIRAVSEHDQFENQRTFRSLGDGLFEFKTRKTGIRLFAFYDEIEGIEPQLIITTSGFLKGKGQDAAIAKARKLRTKYLSGKSLPDTEIEIKN